MQSLDNTSFHEASVNGIEVSSGSICVSLEGVTVDDQKRDATVLLNAVTQVVRDGIQIDHLSMEYPDGEVLTLERTSRGIHLIVECNDFENHGQVIRSYHIEIGIGFCSGGIINCVCPTQHTPCDLNGGPSAWLK